MKNMLSHKPCFICHGKAKEKKSGTAIRMIPTERRTILEWYGICECCLDLYPEIQTVFTRISDLKDDEEPCNHTIMFNLIESIKMARWGCRFIPPYNLKKDPK